MQENIRRKFEAYRRATKIKSLNESSSYGLNSDNLGQIFAHWQFKYNYRERTRYFNKYDHFKTNIQGLDMHFIHVKPTTPGNVRVSHFSIRLFGEYTVNHVCNSHNRYELVIL